MTAASSNKDRKINTPAQLRRLLAEISANPYQGSVIGLATDGYAHEIATLDNFVGFAEQQVPTRDAALADGDSYINTLGGLLIAVLPLTGVAQDDVVHGRLVYASDDDTFNMTGSGALIGQVVGVYGTDLGVVACRTHEHQQHGGPFNGFVTLADAAATLDTRHLDKLLVITPSTGRTLTLPPAADCTGRSLTVKTLAAQVVTLDGNGAETIEGSATFTALDAVNDVATFISNGTAWLLTSARIA